MANLENGQSLNAQQSRDFANALTRGIAAATQPLSAAAAVTADAAASSSVAITPAAAAAAAPAAGSLHLWQLRQATAVPDPSSSSSGTPADADSSTAAAAGTDTTTLQHSNDTLSISQAYTTLVHGAVLLSAAQTVMLGGSASAAGGAGVCVAPALIPQKLAGGFTVAFDCRGVSAPAEVSCLVWLLVLYEKGF
jgi:hypothetical protein